MAPHLVHTETGFIVAMPAGVFMCVGQGTRREKSYQSLFSLNENVYLHHAVSFELTFAGRHAFKPLVINIIVVGTSTVLKPSTARSATTVPARFLEHAAFGAC